MTKRKTARELYRAAYRVVRIVGPLATPNQMAQFENMPLYDSAAKSYWGRNDEDIYGDNADWRYQEHHSQSTWRVRQRERDEKLMSAMRQATSSLGNMAFNPDRIVSKSYTKGG